MDSSEHLLRICALCLRDTLPSSKSYSFSDSENQLKTFIRIFSRFVKTAERKNADDFDVSNLKCCDECSNILKKFCDFYHQYKCLELQLDFMVWKIERIIRLANNLPSRISQAKSIPKEVDSYQVDEWELVKNFREPIIQNCQQKLGRSLPRLSLQRSVSSLPALCQPVFIRNSNESLNVTSESKNENYDDTAQCEFEDDFEDSINTHDDVSPERNLTDKMDESDKTNDVDQVESSLNQDPNHILNSTVILASKSSSLAINNVEIANPSKCKTEPLNDDGIQIENSVNENFKFSTCATNTLIQEQQYNFGRKLPRNATQKQGDNNDNHVFSKARVDSMSNLSNSSFSETSSESSSSDNDDYDTKANVSTLNQLTNRRSKIDKNNLVTRIPQLYAEAGTFSQLKCSFCIELKDSPTELALHEAEAHCHDLLRNKIKKTSCCPRCPYEYLSKRAYVKHHLSTHQNLLNADSLSACKMCSGGKVYRLNSKMHFERFHKIDAGIKPQTCDKCPAYFRKPFQLQMHTIRIHQQDHQCEICFKRLKTRMSLLIHKNKVHPREDENPDWPLGCNFSSGCKKRFRTQAELDHHLLYGHQASVSLLSGRPPKKKPSLMLKCEKCEKEFSCKTYLQGHMSKMHGDKPFVCEECGKAFASRTNFDMHLEFHKGSDKWKWQCAECGKKCTSKQKLEMHGRTHTKEKPFICQFCGEKYAHRHNWRNHLKTKHGDEDGVEKLIGGRKEGNYVKRKGSKKGDCIIAGK